MKVIELPQDRIDKVLSLSDPYDDFDYWSWTMSPIYRAEDEKVKATAGQFYDYGASKGIGHTPSAEATEGFLKSNHLYVGEIAERMKDWLYWKANRKHRRPDEWEARQETAKDAKSLEDILKLKNRSARQLPLDDVTNGYLAIACCVTDPLSH
ncbi:hypothetical protein [Rhizobium ruizarguesonis]|uniref:hypothetical protein n=1 Tax=Rhizobium ruizarguesonis TaxID=2081791 RepID=UPI001FE11FE8|nr:hypothetical protein [Rhizobium ruizarguesonis]